MDTHQLTKTKNGSLITLQCKMCKIINNIKFKKSRIAYYKNYKCQKCGNNERYLIKKCRICLAKKHQSNYFKFSDGLNPICNECWPKYRNTHKNCESSKQIHARLSRKKLYDKDILHSRRLSKLYKEKTPKSFLLQKLQESRKCGRQVNIDIQYLINLYVSQNNRCAITKVEMSHTYGKPNSISIDRIDSTKDYTKGNIQLVCQFINLGKNKFGNAEVSKFISEIISTNRC